MAHDLLWDRQYSHCDLQFGRLKGFLDAAGDPYEKNLVVNWILQYFDYLLLDSNRCHENLVFTAADELLSDEHDGFMRDSIWSWLTQKAIAADDHRQEIMDVCIYERIVEDEPIEWDWRTVSVFSLWDDVRTRWVLKRAYSYFPERLQVDLKEYAKLGMRK